MREPDFIEMIAWAFLLAVTCIPAAMLAWRMVWMTSRGQGPEDYGSDIPFDWFWTPVYVVTLAVGAISLVVVVFGIATLVDV